MVNRYSASANLSLSKNFKVKEFQCKDNSDTVLIDSSLIDILQKMRDFFNKPITIVSGFRTEKYNENCGGTKNSYHLKGMASDIRIDGIKPEVIAIYLEMNGIKGIGLYDDFVHVDTRENKYFWKNTGTNKVESFYKDLI